MLSTTGEATDPISGWNPIGSETPATCYESIVERDSRRFSLDVDVERRT